MTKKNPNNSNRKNRKNKKKDNREKDLVITEMMEEDMNSQMNASEEADKMDRGFSFSEIKSELPELLKYFLIFALALIYWELVCGVRLGAMSAFFLFFIPAQAMFFASFCGFGKEVSSRVTLPIILLIPAIYYIVQLVYYTNFGSLFSISMTGMGADAINDFGWALTDSIIKSIPAMLLIIIPLLLAVVFSIRNTFDFKSYRIWLHPLALVFSCLLWLMASLVIRAFGSERLSPYYYMTSLEATTDATAKKLGCLTTALVESGSYYFGFGAEEDMEFALEENDFISEINQTNDGEAGEEKTGRERTVVGREATSEEAEAKQEKTYVNEALDFDKVILEAEDDETKALAGFFQNREPSTTNDYTGMFEGYNLIYICAESFWNYACNEEITPTLYKMANNGIVLNNYYNSFYNTTTNGEFAFTTSLWPDVSRHSSNGTDIGSFAQSASKYMPQGLGDLFTSEGIPSYAFHNYYGKYYRRILSWPNLGYQCKFTGDGMSFTFNWPASDLELMQQSVDDYINDDQFNVYYMTFSGHGPFTSKNQMFNKNIGEVNRILGTDSYHLDARGYFAGELELDKAMEYLLNRLEDAGKLDKTVIVIAADHYPYYLSDDGRKSLAGYDIDQDFDIYKSNCIIYNAGIKEPIQVNNYCSNVDIAPTVLNLFNIPFDSRLMAGRDIFSEQAHNRAVLYNMSFITDLARYNYENGQVQWSDQGNKLSDEEKEKYISSQLASIENEYKASCRVIDDNFFFKAYKTSGLLSDTEVEQEEQREARVRSEDANYNEKDEMEKAEREAAEEAERQLEEQKAAAEALGGVLGEDGNIILPDGRIVFPNGGILNPDGTITDNPIVTDLNAAADVNAVIDPVTGLANPALVIADPAAAGQIQTDPGTATVNQDTAGAAGTEITVENLTN